MKTRTIAAKDVPEAPILEFLDALRLGKIDSSYETANGLTKWHPSSGTLHPGFAHSITNAMPQNVPERVVLAKMRRLIKRDLVEGCCCGCCGDFEITGKGLEVLAAAEKKEQK